ncbi:MAG: hypothetical protein LAN84_03945 [Acidobacteriia bacterium]|nr:hypothetical protein [Terriglobia bacterium]
MTRVKLLTGFALLLLLALLLQIPFAGAAPAASDAILKANDIGAKLFPEKIFFHGQVTSVQLRNSGGVRFSDDAYTLAGVVDASGYASGIREKLQGYLISEVALVIGGQKLPTGAYGFGFLKDGKFVAMDLGAHDVLQVASSKDAEMKRPVPLQVASAAAAGTYRLYMGRDFVEFSRSK